MRAAVQNTSEIEVVLLKAGGASDLLQFLSAEELARSEQMAEDTRQLFVAGRALLRKKLGSIMAIDPKEVPIAVSPSGRPYVRCEEAEIFFSLSHTKWRDKSVVGCALSRESDIGLDVEFADRTIDWQRIARRRFAACEWQEIDKMLEGAGRDRFFRLWTLKEAIVKLQDGKLLNTLKKSVISWHSGKPSADGSHLYLSSVYDEDFGLFIGVASDQACDIHISYGA